MRLVAFLVEARWRLYRSRPLYSETLSALTYTSQELYLAERVVQAVKVLRPTLPATRPWTDAECAVVAALRDYEVGVRAIRESAITEERRSEP